MAHEFSTSYLKDSLSLFRFYKKLAEGAMEQVSDRHRATLSGFYSVTWSIGFSIGPSIGGWLQSNVGLSASFVFGAFCLILAPSLLITFFGRLLKQPRARSGQRG